MNLVEKSMALAKLLRHKPEEFGLELDEYGWAKTDKVLVALNIDIKTLTKIIMKDKKRSKTKNEWGRYSFNEDRTLCRANQGHTIDGILLDLDKETPPDILYHGTVKQFISLIEQTGLKKMQRHHVHLSEDIKEAKRVAGRRKKSKTIILEIDAKQMYEDGIDFFVSKNGVWLTDSVPVKYLKRI